MRNKLVKAAVGLGLVASGILIPSAPAQAAKDVVNTGKPCQPPGAEGGGYKPRYKVVVKSKKPVLTHVQQFSMSPGGKRKETKKVARSTTLRAKVSYNSSAEVGATGLTKVIASASAKVNMSLAASGQHTTTKSKKVTDTIVNRTGKNKAYVFFAGQTRAKGTFRYYYCHKARHPDAWTIYYRPGKWTSFAVPGEGAVRCGAGSQTALQKRALKVGCA